MVLVLWLVVQLSGWAKSHRSLNEIILKVQQTLKNSNLAIFIPVNEDAYGKQSSPYSEYIFLEYQEYLNYYDLEEQDEFVRVLRHVKSDSPHLISDKELIQIRSQSFEYQKLAVDSKVKIINGLLRGNFGFITRVFEGEFEVNGKVGQENYTIILSAQHVRKMPSEKLLPKPIALINSPVTSKRIDRFGSAPKIRLIRRGSRNSRLMINGRSTVVPNTELAKYLPEYAVPSNLPPVFTPVFTPVPVSNIFSWIDLGEDLFYKIPRYQVSESPPDLTYSNFEIYFPRL
jgi:hypothetical protein